MNRQASLTYSTRRVQEALGISRSTLTRLVSTGYVVPGRGARQALTFTFSDLMLLRAALSLQEAGISSRKTLQAIARLKKRMPTELPLTGLRLTAVGDDVAVRDVNGILEAPSGQLLMDFTVAPVAGVVTFFDRRQASPLGAPGGSEQPQPHAPTDAEHQYRQGETLETTEPQLAERAYREALRLDPAHVSAYLNLGAMLCEAGRCEEAVALYDQALTHCRPSALLHFNQAVALEDLGRHEQAITAYEACLALDAALADAHFNIGRLHELQGDRRKALRHYGAYRRLQP